MKVTVKIENAYEDGHESTNTVDVDAPTCAPDTDAFTDWWEQVVYDHTGDGHGIGTDLGSCYVATIIAADDASLIGESTEWTD